jgi:hypothetical protein
MSRLSKNKASIYHVVCREGDARPTRRKERRRRNVDKIFKLRITPWEEKGNYVAGAPSANKELTHSKESASNAH